MEQINIEKIVKSDMPKMLKTESEKFPLPSILINNLEEESHL